MYNFVGISIATYVTTSLPFATVHLSFLKGGINLEKYGFYKIFTYRGRKQSFVSIIVGNAVKGYVIIQLETSIELYMFGHWLLLVYLWRFLITRSHLFEFLSNALFNLSFFIVISIRMQPFLICNDITGSIHMANVLFFMIFLFYCIC